MLLIVGGIMLVLYAFFQNVYTNGLHFWKDTLFWMLMVAAGLLSLLAVAGSGI